MTVDIDLDPPTVVAARPRRARATRTNLVLGGLALVIVGGIAGALTQQNFGATAANAGGNVPAGFTNGGPAGATPQASGAATTTGTVKLVDGTTLYLTRTDGTVVTVAISGTTTLSAEQASALTNLAVGATVTVQGTTNSDGSITATTVTATK